MWDVNVTCMNDRYIYHGHCPNGHPFRAETVMAGGFAAFEDLRCIVCNEVFGEVRADRQLMLRGDR